MNAWIQDYVQTLSPAEFQFHCVLIAIFIGFLLYRSFQSYQRFRFIRDTPTSYIRSAAQGYVVLKGIGEMIPGPEITSPFSQSRCLWYQCIVERRKQLNKNTVWLEESNEISDHIFHLHDETGNCIVIPDGAQVIPKINKKWYGNHINVKHKHIQDSLILQRYLSFGRYRFTEKLIMVADPLYVIGNFKSIQKTVHPETIKQQVEQLLNTWKLNPHRYLSDFDIDKNGKIQNEEWVLIRNKAELEVLKRHQKTEHHTIQKPDESNQPFVISAILEEEILNKNKRMITIYFMVFFTLLYILITALNVPH